MKSSSHIELALLLAILLKAINSFQTRQTFIRPTISVSGNTIKSINPNPRKMSSTILQVSPKALLGEGMQKFRGGDIQGSIDLFDEVDKSASDGSLRPYLWQRGISYYYADQFKEGSDQFRLDVSVNPLDVEEIVWDIACLSRLDPSIFPPAQMMSLPKGKKDRRKIMGTVYALFRGEAREEDLAVAGHQGSATDEFYSLFYLGLYNEMRGNMGNAENYMKSAAKSQYATAFGSGDYMSSCAKVHCKLRGWI